MKQSEGKMYLILALVFILIAVLLRFALIINFPKIEFARFIPLITLIPIILYFLVGVGLLKNDIQGIIIVSTAVLLSHIIKANSFEWPFFQEGLMRLIGSLICLLIFLFKK